ncbi:N/A [soil metagenome]
MSQDTFTNHPHVMDVLRSGESVFALAVRFSRTTDIVRYACTAGYRVIWVDLEHSGISLDQTAAICGVCNDLGMSGWVRVPEHDYGVIGRVLDGGATGVIVPRVETAEQAGSAVSAARFAPLGQRSQIGVLPHLQFRKMPAAVLNETIDKRTVVQVLIESKLGLENVEAIAATPGVDLVGVGLNDLSADMGCLGKPDDPELAAACDHIVQAARRAGKMAVVGGIHDPSRYAGLIASGAAPLVMAGMDGEVLLAALHERVAQSRKLLGIGA